MAVERSEIPSTVPVITNQPVTPITEKIVWKTRIFQSADGIETRTPTLPFPNYEITYNFLIDLNNKPMIDSILQAAETVTWGVPLFYQLVQLPSSFTVRRSPFFPLHRFICLVCPTAGNIVYKELADGHDRQSARLSYKHPLTAAQLALLDVDDLFVCPYVEAELAPEISVSLVGESREGDTARLVWRWRGEYEAALNYTANFNFLQSAQSPVTITNKAPQVDFKDEFTQVERYKPEAVPVESGRRTNVKYYLDTSNRRDDYLFRGAMLRLQGGVTAERLLFNTSRHRLFGGKISISYEQTIAEGMMSVKEVAI